MLHERRATANVDDDDDDDDGGEAEDTEANWYNYIFRIHLRLPLHRHCRRCCCCSCRRPAKKTSCSSARPLEGARPTSCSSLRAAEQCLDAAGALGHAVRLPRRVHRRGRSVGRQTCPDRSRNRPLPARRACRRRTISRRPQSERASESWRG